VLFGDAAGATERADRGRLLQDISCDYMGACKQALYLAAQPHATKDASTERSVRLRGAMQRAARKVFGRDGAPPAAAAAEEVGAASAFDQICSAEAHNMAGDAKWFYRNATRRLRDCMRAVLRACFSAAEMRRPKLEVINNLVGQTEAVLLSGAPDAQNRIARAAAGDGPLLAGLLAVLRADAAVGAGEEQQRRVLAEFCAYVSLVRSELERVVPCGSPLRGVNAPAATARVIAYIAPEYKYAWREVSVLVVVTFSLHELSLLDGGKKPQGRRPFPRIKQPPSSPK
jgi:hypothetical protein